MRALADRFIGAARLTPAIYEGVEADKTATGQALLVLASVAAGIGLTGEGTGLLVGTIAALFGWVIWTALIYVLGAKVFPQPQLQIDIGELLRTTGFAAGPVLAPLAVDQAAARCSYEHESGGDPPAAVSTIATNTRRVTSRPVKMSLRANRLVTRPACMAGVLVSRPNRKARCGRTKL